MSQARRSRLVPEIDFDRDGAQHGFVRLFHSTHASAYGFIPIPIVVIRNGGGPTVLFTGGNHGDEYEGQVAITKLIQWLKPEMIRGRVILLPALNFPAAMAGRRVSPIDAGNLNRTFPGDPDGTVTQQIAWFVEHELVARADLCADLHSGGSSLQYVPSVLAKLHEEPGLQAAHLAALRAFGAPFGYVARTAQGQGADQTITGATARQGKIGIGTELGGAGTVGRAALEIGERGLRNLLVHAGVLGEEHRIAAPETRVLEVGGPDYFVYTPDPGVFEPLVELGETVTKGQPAGRIHTPETPWRASVEVAFGHEGIVLCKRIPGRTERGDCLFHLGTDWRN
jgi:predicted deacylase